MLLRGARPLGSRHGGARQQPQRQGTRGAHTTTLLWWTNAGDRLLSIAFAACCACAVSRRAFGLSWSHRPLPLLLLLRVFVRRLAGLHSWPCGHCSGYLLPRITALCTVRVCPGPLCIPPRHVPRQLRRPHQQHPLPLLRPLPPFPPNNNDGMHCANCLIACCSPPPTNCHRNTRLQRRRQWSGRCCRRCAHGVPLGHRCTMRHVQPRRKNETSQRR